MDSYAKLQRQTRCILFRTAGFFLGSCSVLASGCSNFVELQVALEVAARGELSHLRRHIVPSPQPSVGACFSRAPADWLRCAHEGARKPAAQAATVPAAAVGQTGDSMTLAIGQRMLQDARLHIKAPHLSSRPSRPSDIARAAVCRVTVRFDDVPQQLRRLCTLQ